MLYRCHHCLLALLMILQSVSAAWAQMPAMSTPPVATPAMQQPSKHCEMMAKHAMEASDSREVNESKPAKPNDGKSGCHCCDKPCTPTQCAAMHLQAALPDLRIAVPFAPAEQISARYSQIAGTLYLAPPTRPPNAL